MGRQGSAASTDTGAHLRSTASDSPHVTAQQAQLDEQQEDADGFYQYLCQQAVVSAAAAHMPYTAASPGQHHPPQLPAHLHAPPNNLQTSSCMTSTTAAPPPAATTTPHNATANIPTASTTTTSSTSSSSGVPVLIVQAPHCPSALARPAWSVSQFELRSTQYEGGHSIVWRAVDRRSGITLALKAYKRAGLNEIERHQVCAAQACMQVPSQPRCGAPTHSPGAHTHTCMPAGIQGNMLT